MIYKSKIYKGYHRREWLADHTLIFSIIGYLVVVVPLVVLPLFI